VKANHPRPAGRAIQSPATAGTLSKMSLGTRIQNPRQQQHQTIKVQTDRASLDTRSRPSGQSNSSALTHAQKDQCMHPPMHDPAKHADATSRFNPHRRQKNIPTRRVTGRYNTTSCRPPSGQNSTAYPRRPSKPTGNRYRNTRRSNPRTGLLNAIIDASSERVIPFKGRQWLAGTGHFSQRARSEQRRNR